MFKHRDSINIPTFMSDFGLVNKIQHNCEKLRETAGGRPVGPSKAQQMRRAMHLRLFSSTAVQ